MLIAGCQSAATGANEPASPTEQSAGMVETDKQLKINKEALLKGSSEQIRIDAATVMLFSDAPSARKILLDTLKQSENNVARIAVCKTLGQTRGTQQPVKNKNDFIQPLLETLKAGDPATAKSAAEALLIFDYDEVAKPLEKMATDASQPLKTRLNAIEALKLQPDMNAVFKLIELLDDPDKEIASASEKALKFVGITIGKDARTRRQNIGELKRKGKDEFLRDWLIRQEARMRQLESELDAWQGLYLSALDKIYNSITDETAKGKFLDESLGNSNSIIKLWALEKLYQSRVGTTSKFPPELGPILINLVSDTDKNVRLKTAKLLSLMGQLNSAEKLLEQLKIESDDEVQAELLVALGGACHYAFSPNSEFKISSEIRKQALEWSAKYISDPDSKKAQRGTEVIKKLLEQDGLSPAEVNKYLGLIANKYNQQKGERDSMLRGELLSAMAGLCAQSAYKAEAGKLFKPMFEDALDDEAEPAREAAVEGLIYIDKTMALKKLRTLLVNDNSIIIRKRLIDLAGEVGGQEDLVWLSEKIGAAQEGEPAWQAMLKIFKGCGTAVLNDWIAKFESEKNEAELSNEQMISLLEIAETKAVNENDPEMIKNIRERLAVLYADIGKFEQAAACLGAMRQAAATAEEKDQISDKLLDVYLKWSDVKLATQLLTNRLLEKDLEPNAAAISAIENYLSRPPGGADPNAMLASLSKINIPKRPIWDEQVKGWNRKFAYSKDPNQK
jgi:HEAT repeat protein